MENEVERHWMLKAGADQTACGEDASDLQTVSMLVEYVACARCKDVFTGYMFGRADERSGAATSPSPLTEEQAKERAQKQVTLWFTTEFVSDADPRCELLVNRITSELMDCGYRERIMNTETLDFRIQNINAAIERETEGLTADELKVVHAAVATVPSEAGETLVYSADVFEVLRKVFTSFRGRTMPVSEVGNTIYRELQAVLAFAAPSTPSLSGIYDAGNAYEATAQVGVAQVVEMRAELALREQRISELVHEGNAERERLMAWKAELEAEIISLRKANEEVSIEGALAELRELFPHGFCEIMFSTESGTEKNYLANVVIAVWDTTRANGSLTHFDGATLAAALEAARQSREDEGK